MATVQINNAKPIRLDGGGQIIFNNGTDDLVLNVHEVGSVRIVHGGYDLGRYENYGAPKVPILRSKQRTVISVSATVTTELSTADKFFDLSTEIDSTNGLAKTYTFSLKIPDKTDGTTGHLMPYANTYFVRPHTYRQGVDFDFFEAELESLTHIPTVTTY